ncbi:MAG TPA: hypothetical protein VFX53_09405 [Pedococcus sp.]|nr:hypothetical protein [Pedococcus sp.]
MSTGVLGGVPAKKRGERVARMREERGVGRRRLPAVRVVPVDGRPELIIPLGMLIRLGAGLLLNRPVAVAAWMDEVPWRFTVHTDGQPLWVLPLPEEVIAPLRTWLAVGMLLLLPMRAPDGDVLYFYLDEAQDEPETDAPVETATKTRES